MSHEFAGYEPKQCNESTCEWRCTLLQKSMHELHTEPAATAMPAKSQDWNTNGLLEPLVVLSDDKSVGKEEVLLCRICEQSGDGIVQCSGPCLGMYHTACTGHSSHDGSYLCEECYTGKSYVITFRQLSRFVCH